MEEICIPCTCASNKSGSSSNNKLSKSTFLNLCSKALVQCAIILTTSSTKYGSGVIFEYHVCTNSLIMIAMKAYSCKSTSLLLVNGGRISSIGAGVLRPLSLRCVHRVRRIRKSVARSATGSADWRRLFWREMGVSTLRKGSFDTSPGVDEAEAGDIFDVATALRRG